MFLRGATSLLSGRVCTSARVCRCALSDDAASLVPVKLMALVNQTRRSNELVAEPLVGCRVATKFLQTGWQKKKTVPLHAGTPGMFRLVVLTISIHTVAEKFRALFAFRAKHAFSFVFLGGEGA